MWAQVSNYFPNSDSRPTLNIFLCMAPACLYFLALQVFSQFLAPLGVSQMCSPLCIPILCDLPWALVLPPCASRALPLYCLCLVKIKKYVPVRAVVSPRCLQRIKCLRGCLGATAATEPPSLRTHTWASPSPSAPISSPTKLFCGG